MYNPHGEVHIIGMSGNEQMEVDLYSTMDSSHLYCLEGTEDEVVELIGNALVKAGYDPKNFEIVFDDDPEAPFTKTGLKEKRVSAVSNIESRRLIPINKIWNNNGIKGCLVRSSNPDYYGSYYRDYGVTKNNISNPNNDYYKSDSMIISAESAILSTHIVISHIYDNSHRSSNYSTWGYGMMR